MVNKAPKRYSVKKAKEAYDEMRKTVKDCKLPDLDDKQILVLEDIDHDPDEAKLCNVVPT